LIRKKKFNMSQPSATQRRHSTLGEHFDGRCPEVKDPDSAEDTYTSADWQIAKHAPTGQAKMLLSTCPHQTFGGKPASEFFKEAPELQTKKGS